MPRVVRALDEAGVERRRRRRAPPHARRCVPRSSPVTAWTTTSTEAPPSPSRREPSTATDRSRRSPAAAIGVERVDGATEPTSPRGPIWLLRDCWTEATRHLRAMPRNPELLVFATIQPIMFVVLFVYVFGGADRRARATRLQAVRDPGDLRPDGAVRVGLHRHRHRRRPHQGLHRPAPLAADVPVGGAPRAHHVRPACATRSPSRCMLVVAFLDRLPLRGLAARRGRGHAAAVRCSPTRSAGSRRYIGLSVESVEAANSARFLWMFPLTFVSSAFVDTETMPGWLQPIADAQPVHHRHQRQPRALQRPRPGCRPLARDPVGGRHHRGVRRSGVPQVLLVGSLTGPATSYFVDGSDPPARSGRWQRRAYLQGRHRGCGAVRSRWGAHRLEPAPPLPSAHRRRGGDGGVPGHGVLAGLARCA